MAKIAQALRRVAELEAKLARRDDTIRKLRAELRELRAQNEK